MSILAIDGKMATRKLQSAITGSSSKQQFLKWISNCGLNWKHACSLLDNNKVNADFLDVTMFNEVMKVCKNANQFDKTIETFHSIEQAGLTPDHNSFVFLLHSYRQNKQWKESLNVLNSMKMNNIKPAPFMFQHIIQICKKINNFHEAEKAFYTMIDFYQIKPSVIHFNELISILGYHFQFDKSLLIYQKMLELNVKPNIITYNSLMSACLKNKQYLKVIEFFKIVEKDEIKYIKTKQFNNHDIIEQYLLPDRYSYTYVILAYAGLKQWTCAIKYFHEMEHNKNIIKPHNNLKLINTIIDAYGKNGQYENAIQLFNILKNQEKYELKPDIVSYCCIMSVCKNHGQWEQSIEIFDSIQTIKKSSNIKPNIVCLNIVISACEIGGQWEKALEILNIMENEYGIKPDVISYNTVISACEKNGQWEKALQLLECMEKDINIKPDVISYTTAISACAKGGQWEKALEIFDAMNDNSSFIENNYNKHRIKPNLFTYNAFISACEKGGRWEKALEILNTMENEYGIKPDVISYNTVISACAKGGQWEKALRLLHRMENDDEIQPDVVSYNAAITACRNQNQWAKAVYILTSMERRGIKPDIVSYNSAISVCEKNGQWEKAIEIFESIYNIADQFPTSTFGTEFKHNIKPDIFTFNTAMNAYLKNGNIEHVFHIFNSLTNPDEFSYCIIINACEKSSQYKLALDIFNGMVLGDKQSVVKPNTVCYNAIISSCAQSDTYLLQGFEILEKMEKEEKIDKNRKVLKDLGTYIVSLSLLRKIALKQNNNNNNMEADIIMMNQNTTNHNDDVDHAPTIAVAERSVELIEEMFENHFQVSIINLNTALTTCSVSHKKELMLKLFQLMKNNFIKGDMLTYSLLIKMCEENSDYENANLFFYQAQQEQGLYSNVWKFRKKYDKNDDDQNKDDVVSLILQENINKIDLHNCTIPVARTVLRIFIDHYVTGLIDQNEDYYIITGQGEPNQLSSNKDIEDNNVENLLSSKMREFLHEQNIVVTEIPENPGRLLLKSSSLSSLISLSK